jgi:hypothetical protein
MDIRFDDHDDLARNHIRFQPVVLRSLPGAGYAVLAICAGCLAGVYSTASKDTGK